MPRLRSYFGQMKRRCFRAIRAAVDVTPATQKFWYANGNAFRDELAAVVSGNRRFEGDANPDSENALYTLRRNTHRLEKGLIMRPRRDVFALDFIGDTVEAYRKLYGRACDADEDTRQVVQWSSDVLEAYFAAVVIEKSEVLRDCHAIYDTVRRDDAVRTKGWSPYQRPTHDMGLSVDQLKELSIRRRSCRWYKPDRVPREVIEKAMDVARFAPSACNRQPFYYRVFDDPKEAVEVGAIPNGTRGFSENFPCFIVIVGTLAAFPHPRDRHVIYVDASLAAMAFQYALEVQGVSSCCINWPDLQDKNRKIEKRLDLKPYERVVMCMSVGYPDPEGQVPFSQKKSPAELLKYENS